MYKTKHLKVQVIFIFLTTVAFLQSAMGGLNSSGYLWNGESSVKLIDTTQQNNNPDNDPPDNGKQNPLLPSFVFDDPPHGGISLGDPPNVTTEIIYDPETNQYQKVRKVGDRVIGRPAIMTFEEYLDYDMDKALKRYWVERSKPQDVERRDGFIPEIYVSGELFDRIFGGSTIDIRPTGSAELIFGVMSNKREDPSLDERRRRQTNFDFQQKIQVDVDAQIGEKVRISSNYNTESTFDFENRIKLEYQGTEDDILQLVEAGDITLPLPGTLIRGNQGLFGIKTQWKFGNTTITNVFSQQQTETKTIEVSGGAQTSEFKVRADEYDKNRHFFLGQYFRDNYDEALSTLPTVSSNININRIEVWVTNIGAATEDNRNIVAFSDLGEDKPYNQNIDGDPGHLPSNQANELYDMMKDSPIRDISQVSSYLSQYDFSSGVDYENIENARRLSKDEYKFNSKLGFISLNRSIDPDQVLAVAFEYTIIGEEGSYKVGEFSDDISSPRSLIVKMLKSTSVNTNIPMWDLMMKNVYSIDAYQVNRQDFRLNVLYDSEELGVPVGFLDEGPVKGEPLIRVMGLDNLNTQMDPVPDGVFDFIDNAATQGGTIESANGRIYFPVVEPFGSHLRKKLEDEDLGDKYAFDSLYTTTRHKAQQYPEKNRFFLEGMYKSEAGSEIYLDAMNIPPGSVVVTAGGVPLTEDVDYTVDYNLGRVQIINEGILNSGTPIRISLESSDQFGMKTKTLLGAHVNHRISDDFNIGGTIMRLSERPLTQKVGYGDEPIANTIWGLNTTYTTESRFITRMLDRLPFYSTSATSRITFDGEFAHLIPGHSRHIEGKGAAYIDDFEGSKSAINLKNVQSWSIASTPQGQTRSDMFPEAASGTELAFRYNVAKLAWYTIDPLFLRNDNLTPSHIRNDVEQQSNHFVREVLETEIWPNKESPTGLPAPIPVFNMAYYPSEKGPYNYDAGPSPYSHGVAEDGSLEAPQTRWGGIMRGLSTTDFEAANVEYIEFWMMDPFVYDEDHQGGDLYFNLGDVSEDVLRDGRKSFENGLPIDEEVVDVDTTIWGRVPIQQDVTNAFDNDPTSREYQDVGLDGLSTEDERDFFSDYLDEIAALHGPNSQAYEKAYEDPSSDNFKYYRSSTHDQNETSILERYKRYNGLEGNSPTSEQSPEPYPTAATDRPDTEDINQDGTLNESEKYFQYRVSLRPEDMVVGENYITDKRKASVRLANGETEQIRWYQFKIPLRDPDRQAINDIQDFQSIRFMRMFFKNFEEPIICRFATLELIRGDWRTYDRSLTSPGEYLPVEDDPTSFDVFTVNIEENAHRQPIPYVLPPGIEREVDLGTTAMQQRNEQSLAMRVQDLEDGDARAVYKTTSFDMRQYRRIRMFAHAEAVGHEDELKDDDLNVFIRLGSDFTNNYYEYEVPMEVTPWGSSHPEDVWPENNEFDIYLEKLQELKLERNSLSRESDSGVSMNRPFSMKDGDNKMTIIGTPTLSDVKVIMIGIRNPKRKSGSSDDGMPKSAEIWVNELRLYDFDDESGWAASGRINTELADLGNLTLAGMISTPGYGSIEEKVSDRQKEQYTSYDIATNLQLGKFFPEDLGLRIPMHFNYSESVSSPQYNPLNPDLLFSKDIDTYDTQAERDSIKKITQDFQRHKSINFTNVRKERTDHESPVRLWDIENFDFTYSYHEMYSRNIDIKYDRQQHWKGGIGYNYTTSPKNITPFSDIDFLNQNAFSLIRDFNFYYKPNMVSLRTNMERGYGESLMRDKSKGIIILEPNYVKSFNWDRFYDVRWDLTKNLKLDYSAVNNARIDEPPGRIDRDADDYPEKRDSIMNNIRRFGRTTFFNQKIDLTYNIPFNKLPLMDWINANAQYTANYDWAAAHLSEKDLGNTIENSNVKRLNVNANFVNLYNKIDFLNQINQKGSGGQQQNRRGSQRNEEDDDEEDERPDFFREVIESTLRLMMSLRTVSLDYSETQGTRLPGFLPSPQLFGQNWDKDSPGMGFILGSQEDFRKEAARKGWITDNPNLNTAYITNKSQNITGRATIEPLPGLRIDVSAQRNSSRGYSEYFRADSLGNFDSHNPMETGSFSISFLSISTIFDDIDDRHHTSANFEKFKNNRHEIAWRLAMKNDNWDGTFTDKTDFPAGYGPNSQEVLIASFLATYGGMDVSDSPLSPFLDIPMPNWQITYDNLARIGILSRYLKSATLSHGYQSRFNIGSFQSNINYREKNGDPSAIGEFTGNYIPKYEIGQVSITEQFNPLIGIDITWENDLITRFEYRRSRNLSLSFSNNQLTDISSKEYIIGTGYKFDNLAFNISQASGTQRIESDLVLRLDLAIRENRTVLRKIEEQQNIPSAGQQSLSINFSADYQISPRLNFMAFYDHIITEPFISDQYPTSNIHSGISLRFMLQ